MSNYGWNSVTYDSWRTGYPDHWDLPEPEEEFELCEKFIFGGLTYLLTGNYDGGNLENTNLYLLTNWGRVPQWEIDVPARNSVTTDWITETGVDQFTKAETLTDRAYAVADAALEAWGHNHD